MKICIVGWYGKKNVGDEAFRVVFQRFFEGHELRFVTPPQTCPDSDAVILGGGAVASPFYLNSLPPVPRYAIGIDLAYDSEANLMAEAAFRKIYVRTRNDCELLQKAASCPVVAIPDLAFYIRPTGQDILGKYKLHSDRKTLGVLVTDYVNPAIDRSIELFTQRANNFKINLAAKLDDLYDQGYEVLLIPCSTGGYGDDRRMNLDLAAFMRHSPTNIMDTIGPQEMIDLIAQCDVTLCQRFHAHIFSIIAGTPFISIEFTRKVKTLLQERNLAHWTGGLYQNKNTFDFSNVEGVLKSFQESDSQMLIQQATECHEFLEGIKQQVLADLSVGCP